MLLAIARKKCISGNTIGFVQTFIFDSSGALLLIDKRMLEDLLLSLPFQALQFLLSGRIKSAASMLDLQ